MSRLFVIYKYVSNSFHLTVLCCNVLKSYFSLDQNGPGILRTQRLNLASETEQPLSSRKSDDECNLASSKQYPCSEFQVGWPLLCGGWVKYKNKMLKYRSDALICPYFWNEMTSLIQSFSCTASNFFCTSPNVSPEWLNRTKGSSKRFKTG